MSSSYIIIIFFARQVKINKKDDRQHPDHPGDDFLWEYLSFEGLYLLIFQQFLVLGYFSRFEQKKKKKVCQVQWL